MTISLLVTLPKGINAQPSPVSLQSTHYPLLIATTEQNNKDIWQWIKGNMWVLPFLGVGGLIGLYKLLQSIDKWRFKQHLLRAFNTDLDTDNNLKLSLKDRLKKVLIKYDDKLFDECLTERLNELAALSNSSPDKKLKIKHLDDAFRGCIKVVVLKQEIVDELGNNIDKNPSRLGNLTVSTQIGHMQSEYSNLNNDFLELENKISELQQRIDKLKSDSEGGQ